MKNYVPLEQFIEEFEQSVNNIIEDIPSVQATKEELEQALSKENLMNIIDQKEDLCHARLIDDNDSRIIYRKVTGDASQHPNLRPEIADLRIEGYKRSGFFAYPENTFCGWHTNSNNVGERLYVVYADQDEKSFFRYYDSEKDEVVTKWEKKGININKFTCSQENLFWHCAGSYCNRISVGFNKIQD